MAWRASRKKVGADRSFFLVLGVAWLGPALRLFAGPIEADVRDLVSRHGFEPSKVAVVIVSQSGKLVVAMNDREPFQPASNQKVLTTAAALYWLGLDHEFETTLSSPGAPQDGLLQGDLIVRGKG